jgi:type IX secretion system PorP/SprF family membrane protein
MVTLPIMVNPATTGVFTNNDISLGAQYRNQWSSLSSSINTFALSFDMPLNNKWAVGGFIKNTDEIGIINSFNFMGSGSYLITDPKSKQYIISVGLQIGFIYKRINSGNLTYDEQYDENYFNTDLPTGENYVRQNTIMPDANIGFYYKNINRRHRARPYGGFSVFHVTYPKEQFLDGSEGRLPLRYLGNVGLEYSVNDQIELESNLYEYRNLLSQKANNIEHELQSIKAEYKVVVRELQNKCEHEWVRDYAEYCDSHTSHYCKKCELMN